MKKLFLAGLLASTGVVAAWGAGFWQGVPIAGGPSYCTGYVNGVCQQLVPGGPLPSGSELIPADTGLAQGVVPQTVLLPSSVVGLPFGINRLVGGDFQTNLAQRLSTTKGIASLAGLTATAATMGADGWWIYGLASSSNITVTIASGTTEALPALGTTKALRLARTASTTGSVACVGQTLDQQQAAPLIGNNAVFSFYELNGAAMSAANGSFTVEMSYSSAAAAGATQATLGYAGSQGSKYAIGTNAATFASSGPTNQTAAVPVLVSGTAGTIGSNGFVTIPGSTTWTRYAVAAPIPTVIPGTTTAVTDVSVQVCFTPTLTSASASTADWIELQGLQLEAKPATVTASLPNGVITPTAFERRPQSVEQLIDYSYWYYNFENQAAINTVANCADVSVTVTNCFIQFPVPMRIVPNVAYTIGFTTFTSTAYTTLGACTGLVAAATLAVLPSQNGALVQCTAALVPAAGTANFLVSLGTGSATGIISASALP